MWEIFTFSDAMMLNKTFNAIAVIFKDGGYKSASIAVGIVAFFMMIMGGLAKGKGGLPVQQAFMGIILYALLFGNLTSVSIENRKTGAVTNIDNIPVALAVPASLMSQIGVYMAQKTEQVFMHRSVASASPRMTKLTEGNYLAPLTMLADVYRLTQSKVCPAGSKVSKSAGIDFCRTMVEYSMYCANRKAAIESKSDDFKEKDLFKASDFTSEVYGAYIYGPDGREMGGVQDCTVVYAKLKEVLDGGLMRDMGNTLAKDIGVDLTHTTVEDEFTEAAAALGIAKDGNEAAHMMRTMFIRRAMEQGTIGALKERGRSDIAENLYSSIQMRNHEWQLQGAMWNRMAGDFISMMEALIYSVAPFVGLMILTGSMGIKVATGYISLLMILQVMPALMVIAQSLVMDTVIEKQIALDLKYEPSSVAYLDELMEMVNQQIAYGGMLASTVVPALAVLIVTGSGMGMLSALKGAAATPKDTDAVSDLANQKASMDIRDYMAMNVTDGGHMYSQKQEETAATIGKSLSLSETISDTQTEATQWGEQKQATLSNMQADVNNGAYTQQQVASSANEIMASSGVTGTQAYKEMDSYLESQGITGQTKASVMGGMTAAMKFDTEKGVVGGIAKWALGASAKAGLKAEAGVEGSLTSSDIEQAQQALSTERGQALSASLSETVKETDVSSASISTGNSELDQDMKQLASSASKADSYAIQHQRAQQLQESLGMTGHSNAHEQYEAISDSNEAADIARSGLLDIMTGDDKELAAKARRIHQEYAAGDGYQAFDDIATLGQLASDDPNGKAAETLMKSAQAWAGSEGVKDGFNDEKAKELQGKGNAINTDGLTDPSKTGLVIGEGGKATFTESGDSNWDAMREQISSLYEDGKLDVENQHEMDVLTNTFRSANSEDAQRVLTGIEEGKIIADRGVTTTIVHGAIDTVGDLANMFEGDSSVTPIDQFGVKPENPTTGGSSNLNAQHELQSKPDQVGAGDNSMPEQPNPQPATNPLNAGAAIGGEFKSVLDNLTGNTPEPPTTENEDESWWSSLWGGDEAPEQPSSQSESNPIKDLSNKGAETIAKEVQSILTKD